MIPQIIQFGEVRRPKLGASLPSVKDLVERGYKMPVQQGLLVYSLVPGGAGERAGLRAVTDDGTIGDILVSADGQPLNNMDDLFRLLDKKQIGETVDLQVYRDGRTSTVPVRLTPTPAGARGTTTRRSVQ